MSLRTGLAGQVSTPVAESTYGVSPSFSGALFSAWKSETLELKPAFLQSKGILAGKLYPMSSRRVITDVTAGGNVVMELPQQHLQQWLFPMFGSYGQTASALTQDASTGAYKAVHAPGPLEGHSFAIQKGVPAVDNGTVEPVTYVGCKISEWEIGFAKGEYATFSATIDARNELAGAGNADPLNVSVPTLATYTAPPGGLFHFAQAQVFTGGTVSTTSGVTSVSSPVLAGNVKAGTIKQTTPMDVERFFANNAGFKAEQLQNDIRAAAGSLTIEWLSAQARYNAFVSNTPTALQFQFIGPAIGSGSDFSTLSFLVPNIFFDGESAKMGGPEVVVQTIPYSVADDGTNNVIQATYWTLDTA